MEATDPILGNPLFVAALLLFLIILPLALRQKKKTSLDKIIARMEAEELKEAAKEEAAQEKAGKEKTAEDTDEPAPAVKEPPATPQETSPVLKKEKKLVKEGVPISHNEETAGLPIAGSGSMASSQGKKSSWDEDFSIASHEDSGNNWVEAEIPGLIIEPFPAEKDSDTEPKAHGPAPAEKESPDKPKPKEILTFKAAPKSTHIFGEDEFEDLHTKEKLPSKVKDPAEKAVEKKSPDKPKPKEILTFKAAPKSTHKFGEDEFEDLPTEEKRPSKVKDPAEKAVEKKETRPPEPEEIPGLGPKDVEIKATVVSHKDIAEKEAGEEKALAPSAGDESTSGIEEPLELEAEIEAIPPESEDRESAPDRPKPKPFFLDLKYLVEDALKAESSEKLSPGMVDRIVTRLNELQSQLEHQLVSQSGKSGPAKRDMRQDRIQDTAPAVAGTMEGLSEKKEVSLDELDGFLFTANRKKSRE